MNPKRTVYLISGPCGIGKSTVTSQLQKSLQNTVLIEGDVLHAMFCEIKSKSWAITWENIIAVTRNFITYGFDVIIDYVVEDELEWIHKKLEDLEVIIKYSVLIAEKKTIAERLNNRGDTEALERSLFLLEKLKCMRQNEGHLIDTTNKNPSEVVRYILGKQ